jgi:hypothetical protein
MLGRRPACDRPRASGPREAEGRSGEAVRGRRQEADDAWPPAPMRPRERHRREHRFEGAPAPEFGSWQVFARGVTGHVVPRAGVRVRGKCFGKLQERRNAGGCCGERRAAAAVGGSG